MGIIWLAQPDQDVNSLKCKDAQKLWDKYNLFELMNSCKGHANKLSGAVSH